MQLRKACPCLDVNERQNRTISANQAKQREQKYQTKLNPFLSLKSEDGIFLSESSGTWALMEGK